VLPLPLEYGVPGAHDPPVSATACATHEEEDMSKQKGPDSTRSRSIAKEKIVPVAEGSQQPRAPGWVAPGGANVQSANIEQLGASLRARGALQGGLDHRNVGTQQAGWSSRQSAQRMQARGEEDRLNASSQGGQTAQPASDYQSKKNKKGSSGAGQ
jgi:hypothetical protein